MNNKLKRFFVALWHEIKALDWEHWGIHFDNYGRLFASTIGIAFFGFMMLMGFAYLPVLQAEVRTASDIVSGDTFSLLFRLWPMISFANALFLSCGGLAWSLYEFSKSFSRYDSYYKRVVELRAIINDAGEGIRGNNRGKEWLKSLSFIDGDEAREVANFVFLGRRLGLNTKSLVEDKFKEAK